MFPLFFYQKLDWGDEMKERFKQIFTTRTMRLILKRILMVVMAMSLFVGTLFCDFKKGESTVYATGILEWGMFQSFQTIFAEMGIGMSAGGKSSMQQANEDLGKSISDYMARQEYANEDRETFWDKMEKLGNAVVTTGIAIPEMVWNVCRDYANDIIKSCTKEDTKYSTTKEYSTAEELIEIAGLPNTKPLLENLNHTSYAKPFWNNNNAKIICQSDEHIYLINSMNAEKSLEGVSCYINSRGQCTIENNSGSKINYVAVSSTRTGNISDAIYINNNESSTYISSKSFVKKYVESPTVDKIHDFSISKIPYADNSTFDQYTGIPDVLTRGRTWDTTNKDIVGDVAIPQSLIDAITGINEGIRDWTDVKPWEDTYPVDKEYDLVIGTDLSIPDALEKVNEDTPTKPDPDEPSEDYPFVLPEGAYDLTKKFPFSIPFDIVRAFKKLSSDSIPPNLSFKYYFEPINYTFKVDIDLDDYRTVLEIFRIGETILFVIGLGMVTGKLTKWGQ